MLWPARVERQQAVAAVSGGSQRFRLLGLPLDDQLCEHPEVAPYRDHVRLQLGGSQTEAARYACTMSAFALRISLGAGFESGLLPAVTAIDAINPLTASNRRTVVSLGFGSFFRRTLLGGGAPEQSGGPPAVGC
jgi:hypothetical protein